MTRRTRACCAAGAPARASAKPCPDGQSRALSIAARFEISKIPREKGFPAFSPAAPLPRQGAVAGRQPGRNVAPNLTMRTKAGAAIALQSRDIA